MKTRLSVIILIIFTGNILFAQSKKILLEEMTTTLCGFCPPKSIDLQRMADTIDEVIVVVHHAGFGKDAMTCAPSTAFANAFSPNHFPSMTIDRIKFDSVPGYYTQKVGVSMMAFKWADTTLAILNRTSPQVTVGIEKNYNTATREIAGNIKVKFLTKPESGDFRINLYILEDSVVGDTGKYDYDQKNYITNDPKYPELMGKSVIIYKAHNDVVRAAPLGDWGAEGVIPTNPVVNNIYSKDFSYFLPQKYDVSKGHTVAPDRIYLVAFVSYFNTDTWKRRVINAEKVSLTDNGSSMIDNVNQTGNISVFPNPANEFTNVNFSIFENDVVTFNIYDQSGKKIYQHRENECLAGSYRLTINTSDFNNGVYVVRIQSSNSINTAKIMVCH